MYFLLSTCSLQALMKTLSGMLVRKDTEQETKGQKDD